MREAFKEAMSRFAAGVTVVFAGERGMTASAFFSLSLDPPLVALGVSERARLLPALLEADRFTVSLLREGQEGVADHFAGRASGVGFSPGQALLEGEPPRVKGALAALVCRLEAHYPGGDHRIVVGRVEEVHLGEMGPPLAYFHRAYRRLC
ncbi:MAG: MFS transporter [Thermus sp.]|uniref:4-hydroxyphenylacetate 3-monooxygenase reductase subunit n=1 Tax=Thermus sp. TaxID=275 RepID=UPI003327BFAC